ncbi:MAG: hypothetical protein R3E95_17235 [Thiolinea sp.]
MPRNQSANPLSSISRKTILRIMLPPPHWEKLQLNAIQGQHRIHGCESSAFVGIVKGMGNSNDMGITSGEFEYITDQTVNRSGSQTRAITASIDLSLHPAAHGDESTVMNTRDCCALRYFTTYPQGI